MSWQSPGPTRREALAGAIAVLGGVAAADHKPTPHTSPEATPFDFTHEPPRRRKSFSDLTDEEVRLLCLAIGYMRHGSRDRPLSVDNPMQWDQFALAHAHHCTESGHFQVHWSWFFLPWHRAYLYFFERYLAHVLTTVFKEDGARFALPYWDWESHKEVPNTRERVSHKLASPFFGYDLTIDSLSDMLEHHGHAFDNLALHDGHRAPTVDRADINQAHEKGPVWKQHVRWVAFYTSPEYVRSILQFPFEAFAGGEVVSRDDGQGLLEQFPHNFVHDWVGARWGSNRDMGTLRYAALDPLFYLHHANVDRIWSLYPYTPEPDTKPTWAGQAFTFPNVDGKPVRVTVRDIVKKMTNVAYAPPERPAPATRDLLAAVPKFAPEPPRERSETLFEGSAKLSSKPLTLSARGDEPRLKALIDRAADRDNPALSLLEIEAGGLAYSGRLSVRVFVNKEDATFETSTDDKHFIGHIAALDSHAGRKETAEVTHRFRLDVSGPVSSFYQVVRPGEAFALTLVPVGTPAQLKDLSLVVKKVRLKVYG